MGGKACLRFLFVYKCVCVHGHAVCQCPFPHVFLLASLLHAENTSLCKHSSVRCRNRASYFERLFAFFPVWFSIGKGYISPWDEELWGSTHVSVTCRLQSIHHPPTATSSPVCGSSPPQNCSSPNKRSQSLRTKEPTDRKRAGSISKYHQSRLRTTWTSRGRASGMGCVSVVGHRSVHVYVGVVVAPGQV